MACGYGFTVFAASNEEKDFTLFGTGLNSDFQIGYHCARKSKILFIIIMNKSNMDFHLSHQC